MDGGHQFDDRGPTTPVAPLNAYVALQTKAVPQDPIPAFDVRQMMGTGTTAHMVLDGQTYCLRITRSGKLILTK